MTCSKLFPPALLVAVLASSGWLSVATAQDEGERAEPRQYVSCTVMIIVDESIQDMQEKVEQALHDPSTMLEALGPEEDDNPWPEIRFELEEQGGPHAGLIRMIVPLRYEDEDDEHASVDPGKAEHLLDLMIDNLRNKLERGHRFRAELIEGELRQSEQNFERAEGDIEKLFGKRRELLEGASHVGVGSETLLDRIQHLGEQQHELTLASLGAEARRQAIERQIGELQAKARQGAEEDPVAAELVKIVRLREQRIGDVAGLLEAGRASTDDAHGAELALAEATARLLERREEAHRHAGGDVITDLTHELRQLAIAGAETEARLGFIREQLEQAKAGLDKADEFELVVRRLLPEARERYEHALREKHGIKRELESLREPKIEVMD